MQDKVFNLSAPSRCTGSQNNNNYLHEQYNNISTNFQPKQLNPSTLSHELSTNQKKDNAKKNQHHPFPSSRLVSSSSSHCRTSNFRNPHSEAILLVIRKSEFQKEHAPSNFQPIRESLKIMYTFPLSIIVMTYKIVFFGSPFAHPPL